MAKRLRVELNQDTCVNNLNCIKIDPAHFALNDKAYLKNGEIKNYLSYIELELSDKEADTLIKAAKVCPTNSIKVIDLLNKKELVTTKVQENNLREIKAEYDDSKEFVLDKAGYFLIRINKEKNLIEVGFCNERNKLVLKITGEKPIEIYNTLINKENLQIRKDHCAYLGRELQKAYIALQKNLEYVQDDELK